MRHAKKPGMDARSAIGGESTGPPNQRLQCVMDNGEQMMVIHRIQFDEHIVVARRVVTLYHLGNLLQFLHYRVERLRVLQVQSDVRTGLVTNLLGVDDKQ